jgi:hypothetical protein
MGPASQARGGDSLEQRKSNEDSISIFYRMFDSSRLQKIDSGVNEFALRFPVRGADIVLGSHGQATRSLLFSPRLMPGFDAGFHGFDNYRFSIQDTRIFQTTRPYTELDYILGSRAEQTIKVLHTQNLSPTWNAAFEFRYVNSPGNLKNQNTSHGNLRLSSGFATKNRRYSGYFIWLSNRNQASQNGGIVSDTFLTSNNSAYNERFNIPTRLGGDGDFGTNFFSSQLNTGFRYRQRAVLLRHQYDFGQKDSLINPKDSSVTRLFYPRLRLQHQFYYSADEYNYIDNALVDTAYARNYLTYFGLPLSYKADSMRDKWQDITNEAAVILFPQKDNQDQFLKLGTGLQLLKGQFDSSADERITNLYLLGEYRNRTKNKKWDINAFGRLYLSGFNAGDYTGSVTLQSQLGKKAGSLLLGFQNTNRTPAYVFQPNSSFFVFGSTDVRQENWTRFTANYALPQVNLLLTCNYYIVSNYAYFNSFTTRQQEASLQSILHIGAEKKFRIAKHWNWYAELHMQQESSDAFNLPLVYSRNRIAFEGTFYKNLNISTGFEVRYFTPYKADTWSPFTGTWVVQNEEQISNRPDIAAFAHLRIRGLRIFGRLENINTLDISRGFSFVNNNLAAPLYPTPGLFLHLGIYWSFVN